VLRRALEPFYTTKPLGQGTGLGLSLAFSTAQAHGGSLSLSSEAGRGTQVLLRLPALEEGAAPPPAAEPRPAVPEGRELLLVDDEELIRATVPRLLHLRGHRVAAVDSGEAALARLGQGLVPDVMILDLNMPDLGGLETLRRLRATHPRLPVLLASGFLDAATEAAVVADPHLLAITKPFSLDEIQDMLGRFDQT